MQIIPAIDIIEGKCVRLVEGDFKRMQVYNNHPLDVAMKFEDAGLERLHLVDLDGAREGRVRNWKVLDSIAGKTQLKVDFGGGIKSEEDVRIVFDSGAIMATIGSIAIKNETLFIDWIKKYGSNKFFLGADVRNEKITISGWQEDTLIDVFDFIEKYRQLDVLNIFCTDVNQDGKLEGPAIRLYDKIVKRFPDVAFVASGGVSSIEDVFALQETGCAGVIIGKAIYENRITLKELGQINSNQTG